MTGLKEEIATVHSYKFLFKRKPNGLNKILRELYRSKLGIIYIVLVLFRIFSQVSSTITIPSIVVYNYIKLYYASYTALWKLMTGSK